MKYFVGADNLGADHSGGVASQMAFLNLVIGSGHDSGNLNFCHVSIRVPEESTVMVLTFGLRRRPLFDQNSQSKIVQISEYVLKSTKEFGKRRISVHNPNRFHQ